MRILDLARKDLFQILQDWKSGLFLLVMPILFTLFFGFVMGSAPADNSDQDLRLPVGVINLDGDTLASSLEKLLADSEVIRPVVLDDEKAAQASQLVEDGNPSTPARSALPGRAGSHRPGVLPGGQALAAVVIIPSGYTTQLLADEPVMLDVIVNQSQPAGQTALRALETVTGRLLGAVEAAHISLSIAESQNAFTDGSARQAYLQNNLTKAVSAWEMPPLTVSVVKATGDASQNNQGLSSSGFAQASSGMMVQFAIFGLITSAMVLVLERKSRTLQRLLVSPIRRVEVIAGHVLAMFLVIFAQQVILVLLGQFVFGVDYFRQPLAVLLMIIVLALWAASLGLLISAISRKEDQVITLSLIAMFVFAAMGGAWFPLEVAGKTFATIGHVMPTAWAMDGFQNILMRGLGSQSVLMPAGVLFGYALAFFGLAIWRFRFE
jgi:ABC-2 type transport system permease protein